MQLSLFDACSGAASASQRLAVDALIRSLSGRDWTTAADLLTAAGLPVTESNRRRIRALADASAGRVAGGQRGYRLVLEMTRQDYAHVRNWMLSQAREMERRVCELDRVWFSRIPLPS